MNTHQFITSKKGILLIVLSVFFIVAITVASLIVSCGGEPEKKMTTVTSSTDKLPSEQPQVVTESLASENVTEEENVIPNKEVIGGVGASEEETETDAQPADNYLQIRSHKLFLCGPSYSPRSMMCGMFDVSGIKTRIYTNPFSFSHEHTIVDQPDQRIFYAMNPEKAKSLVENINNTLNTDFKLNAYTKEKLECQKNGTTITIIEKIGGNSEKRYITPDSSVVLNHIAKSGFVDFYNDFTTRKISKAEFGREFLFAIPLDKSNASQYDLISAKSSIESQLSSPEDAVVLSSINIQSATVSKGMLSTSNYLIQINQITNVFQTKDLIAISIQFTPVPFDAHNPSDLSKQFDSLEAYKAIWPNSRETTYETLNVLFDYGYSDVSSVEIIDNILADPLKKEFKRQYGGFFALTSTFKPFSVLLIGTKEDVEGFVNRHPIPILKK